MIDVDKFLEEYKDHVTDYHYGEIKGYWVELINRQRKKEDKTNYWNGTLPFFVPLGEMPKGGDDFHRTGNVYKAYSLYSIWEYMTDFKEWEREKE
jgi:hypothetical protein